MCNTTKTAHVELIKFGNLLAIYGPSLRSIQQNCEDDCLSCHLSVQPNAVLIPYSLEQSTKVSAGFCDMGTNVTVHCGISCDCENATEVAELVNRCQNCIPCSNYQWVGI